MQPQSTETWLENRTEKHRKKNSVGKSVNYGQNSRNWLVGRSHAQDHEPWTGTLHKWHTMLSMRVRVNLVGS